MNLTDWIGRSTITPNFSLEERVTYVSREIENIQELLEDYDDIKWIYEALVEYSLALIRLEERDIEPDEKHDLKSWLDKLKKLDPQRNGRWVDLEREAIDGFAVETAIPSV